MICTFYGSVVGGKRFGHTLGFPTANVAPEGEVALPQNGVYAAEMTLLSTGESSIASSIRESTPPFPRVRPPSRPLFWIFPGIFTASRCR